VPFVQEAVEIGSIVHTDGWSGYLPAADAGYDHQVTFLHGKHAAGHRVAPLLKRWLME
jgi:hypothetical protein